MRRTLDRLSDENFDLLIIGGGATGACVARDASLRGLSVALIEKSDFASATSAHNSKLVHGGLRYLRNFEIGLVRESLQERRVWLDIAPHLIHPLPFLLPMTGGGWRSRAIMGAGLSLYDLLAFNREHLPAHRWLGKPAALAREPVLAQPGLKGAFEYHDAQMYSPERLALECLLDADAHGAAIANYVEADALILRGGRIVGCAVRDVRGGAQFEVRAKAVLVAAGPWADFFLAAALGKPASHPLLRSKGIHLLLPQMTRSALLVEAGSGHFFVLPWRGHTLIGTTDSEFRRDPDTVWVSEAEVAEFLALIDRYLPAAKLDRSMVEFFYAGLRPLVADGATDTYHASRRAELVDHAEDGVQGLFSALGGKWTTSRALAQTVTDRIAAKLGAATRACVTATEPLPGGRMTTDFKSGVQARNPAVSDHLLHMYGARVGDVMALADDPALLRPIGEEGDIGAQILFAARAEMALTLGDAVMRRTGIGQFGRPAPATLEAAANIMGAELGWSAARRTQEIAALAPIFETRASA